MRDSEPVTVKHQGHVLQDPASGTHITCTCITLKLTVGTGMAQGNQGQAGQLLQWLQTHVPNSDDEQDGPDRDLLMQLAHQAATPAAPADATQQVVPPPWSTAACWMRVWL